ncbi:UPF0678 fatty acid-binding protein-like protein, putative (macronuclear) [Tetrahymena thermophila SB210]|uniref:UPF0678 fatty acid-binding protein-like protein, putative n=1 Tax=Tetrahymena thermophila (strain SB210) TaxID=312017 RepID=Q23PY3_TETTS|nr:UPF0678 fatty acid-binding protein-like protein, putative [Tetrahymena thermophila SB210]EAR98552.1 UPF0678 fatty acid-binding protein-like protein, putative [Tetrahymena thermophila SB210]|eukprot:XP_001018797.1 UPF0678 fatty acid-binding protein-like protein, putative [Tetrahymena thermophila SB210]
MAEVNHHFFMAGQWSGEGKLVEKGLAYNEQISITQIKPNLYLYTQTTQKQIDNIPLHAETGYFRFNPNNGVVELLLSHPFGVCEIEEGVISQSNKLELNSKDIIRTSSAKEPYVTKVKRVFSLHDNTLSYDVFFATNTYDMKHYLHCDMKLKQ